MRYISAMRHATIIGFVWLLSLLSLLTCGCATDHGEPPITEIPSRGTRVAEGSGRLFFAAPQPGKLYVYDADAGALLHAQPLKANEQFVVDPPARIMTLNGVRQPKLAFNHHHRHEFYFVADPPALH